MTSNDCGRFTVVSVYFLVFIVFCTLLPQVTLADRAIPAPRFVDFSRQDVPLDLKPWMNWVLYDTQPECPRYYNSDQWICQWSPRLLIEIDKQKATFKTEWKAFAKGEFVLPGNSQHWPQQVIIDGKAAIVTERDNLPILILEAGDHTINGIIRWHQMPESIPVPNQSGLLSVTQMDQPVDLSLRYRDGLLWLFDKQQSVQDKDDSYSLQVFRLISDQVPSLITTQLDLEISGRARQINLPSPLLQQTKPLSVTGELPTILQKDGDLLIQARPGRYSIRIVARSVSELNELSIPRHSDWPDSEIWAFQADPASRLVELKGSSSIDASQTGLPKSWMTYPAYRMTSKETLQILTRRRGNSEPEPDQLKLMRSMWMDFDGQGYTVLDQINGSINTISRLNATNQLIPGRIVVNNQPRLITVSGNQQQGVELLRGHVQIEAQSRIENPDRTLSSSGWNSDFQSVNTVLHLPPGWTVLASTDIDNKPKSWLSQWTLWDIFFVLIISSGIARLINWSVGGLTCITLLLTWHLAGAPKLMWVLLLACTALMRVLPSGKLHQVIYRTNQLALLILVLIILPFTVEQVRSTLYPQLDDPRQRHYSGSYSPDADVTTTMVAPFLDDESSVQNSQILSEQGQRRGKESRKSTSLSTSASRRKYKPSSPEQFEQAQNIQTGPGIPNWQWRRIEYSWNSSVNSDQRYTLYLISPFFNKLLNLARIVLVIWLALVLPDWPFGKNKPHSKQHAPEERLLKPQTSLLWLCVVLAGLCFSVMPQSGYADIPNQALLNELKQRLTQPADCLPQCAQLESMQLLIDSEQLQLVLVAHAQSELAFPLPIPEKWYADTITVNRKPALLKHHNKQLWVVLSPGLNKIVIRGSVKQRENLSMALPMRPHWFESTLEDWVLNGLNKDNSASRQLQLTRTLKADTQTTAGLSRKQSRIPAFVSVRRDITLGIDWSVKTTIERLSKSAAPIVLKIPLLDGESVVSSQINVRNNSVLLNLLPEQNHFSWQSRLLKTENLMLTASDNQNYHEIWVVDALPVWHVDFNGIPMLYPVNKKTQSQYIWRPWPGEQLQLNIRKPAASAGQTLTIQSSQLNTQLGEKSTRSTLTFIILSSKGDRHKIQIPSTSRIQSLKIDNRNTPYDFKEGSVTLPINPGTHRYVLEWTEDQSTFPVWKTAHINFDKDSINHTISVVMERNRWLLFAQGPQLGPAILFWGVLIVIAALSYGLARLNLTPLKSWQWFLMLVGMTQTPAWMMLCVIGWLLALGLKQRTVDQINDDYKYCFIQVFLAMLTVSALGVLIYGIHQGLLGTPQMQITGNGSNSNLLNWFADRVNNQLPQATLISVPLYIYKTLMLLWAIWIAFKLLDLLVWGWQCFSKGGLWRDPVTKKTVDKSRTTQLNEE